MNNHAHMFVFLLLILFAILAGLAIWAFLRLRPSDENTWDELLSRLQHVDKAHLAVVALDLLEDPVSQSAVSTNLDPSRIWMLVGGLDGLRVLESNCEVLIDLAAYVQRWYPEAVLVAQELRMNAEEIRWHVGRLKGAAETGNLESSFPTYAQRAVATYYTMTQIVINLYESSNIPRLPDLRLLL